jgi:rhodanese-related sulfurtransferase
MRNRGSRQTSGDRPRPPRATYAARLMLMSTTDEISEMDVEPQRVAGWLTEDPDLQVIDVREPYEREAGHIEGTLHIELLSLSAAAETLQREHPVVFYCRVGARSAMAAQAFRTAGFKAHSMSGGLQRWAAEGRPLSPEGGYVADH